MKRKLIIITSIISAILVLGFCLFLLVLRPNIVNSILSKAEIYMDQKDYINAKKEISLALSLHSENLDAHILNYRLLLITGNEEEILEFSKNAYSKTKNQFFKNLSRDYEKESDFPRLNFESGNYAEEFIVKIINQKDGEEIYYVKNGVRGIYRGEIHIPKGRTQLLLSREGEKGGKEYIFFVGDATEKATLSHQSGIYDAPFYLNITSEGEIFYTLDGLSPTDKSEKYTSPIKIEKTTIL
ncbi:MAG: chitobiase/beta-hexosaminidase C-terminal domain-containing protein, partial [Clostridia bacterium]|nr:chitobiase/beta-hexosaminidase C-terminal domain-containing protein [Clostridia bacterium]